MTRRQRIVLAATSLAVGGGTVLLALAGPAGATAPATPAGQVVVSTSTAVPGQPSAPTVGPSPTATRWTTAGTTIRTPEAGGDSTDGPTGTAVADRRLTAPGKQPTGVGQVATSTAAPTPGADATANGRGAGDRAPVTVPVGPGASVPSAQQRGPATTVTIGPTATVTATTPPQSTK